MEKNDEIDLNALQEFIDGNGIKESETEEIENALEYINNQLTETKPQLKQLKTEEDIQKQEVTIDDLTDSALGLLGKVDKNTDEIYNLFFTPLSLGKDRTDASKIALLDSQRIKVEMINALAGLANAKAKLELARAKNNQAQGVFVSAQNGSEVGISLHNLWEDVKEEES